MMNTIHKLKASILMLFFAAAFFAAVFAINGIAKNAEATLDTGSEQRVAKTRQYIVDHDCKILGFTGSNPQAYFQCGEGMYLQSQLHYLANGIWY